jgi:hypothetical protein
MIEACLLANLSGFKRRSCFCYDTRMASKKVAKSAVKKRAAAESRDTGSPAFPYTTEPNALKRLLTEIPKRPKPPKVTMETLKGWNVSSSNNSNTVVRVLKKIGLLQESGQPTDHYAAYMTPGSGSAVLGQRIRETYRVLFETRSHHKLLQRTN